MANLRSIIVRFSSKCKYYLKIYKYVRVPLHFSSIIRGTSETGFLRGQDVGGSAAAERQKGFLTKMSIVSKIFGTYSDHQLRKLEKIADRIEALAPTYKDMGDE